MSDTERLDWLSHLMGQATVELWRDLGLNPDCMTLREAIDQHLAVEETAIAKVRRRGVPPVTPQA